MADPDLTLGDVFRGAMPFVLTMILCIAIIVVFPPIATYLARL